MTVWPIVIGPSSYVPAASSITLCIASTLPSAVLSGQGDVTALQSPSPAGAAYSKSSGVAEPLPLPHRRRRHT